MVPVVQQYIPAGHPNRSGRKLLRLRSFIIHYTGNDSPGATDTVNAQYFSRSWHKGKDGKPAEWSSRQRLNPDGTPMVTPAGTPIYEKVEVGFAYGSAQVICDEDSITETLPLDEEAYGCGDRRLPWTELNRGQQPGARIWFGNQQNLMTLNVEICNNRDWMKASNNAQDWVVDQLLQRRLKVNVEASLDFQTMRTLKDDEVLIGRHFDVTGKLCPKPLVDDIALWMSFVNMINARTQFAA